MEPNNQPQIAPVQPVSQTNPQPVTPPIMTPPTNPTMIPEMPKENKSWGPILGVIVIVILLVIAAVYVLGQKLNNDAKKMPTESQPVSQQINIEEQQSTAAVEETDEFTQLEANLDSSIEGLDDSNF